jgi:hypothetical protein
MLDEVMRVNKSEEAGEKRLFPTYREGFDSNKEEVLNIKLETGQKSEESLRDYIDFYTLRNNLLFIQRVEI